jgi:hypothetical protein
MDDEVLVHADWIRNALSFRSHHSAISLRIRNLAILTWKYLLPLTMVIDETTLIGDARLTASHHL